MEVCLELGDCDAGEDADEEFIAEGECEAGFAEAG